MILTGETGALGENLVPVPLFLHIPQMEGAGIESGLLRSNACNWLEPWHCQDDRQIATEMCVCVCVCACA